MKRITIFILTAIIFATSCNKDKSRVSNTTLLGKFKGELHFADYLTSNDSLTKSGVDRRTYTLVITETDKPGTDLKLSYVFDSITLPFESPDGIVNYYLFPAETTYLYANEVSTFSKDVYFNIPYQVDEDGYYTIGNKCYNNNIQYDARYLDGGSELRICRKSISGQYYTLIDEVYTKK